LGQKMCEGRKRIDGLIIVVFKTRV